MSDWSSKERAFLDAAKSEWGPSPETASAVRDAVAKRIADPSPGGADESGPAPASPAPVAFGAKALFGLGAVAIGLAALGFVWLGDRPSTPMPVPPPSVIATVAATVIEAPPNPPPAEAVSVDSLPNAVEPPVHARLVPSASAPAADTLSEELVLLRTAQNALRSGSPGDALTALQAHASRFPRGVLRQERMTLQVLALCDAGQVAQARAIRDALAHDAPGSSHLQRLENSCVR